MTHSQEKLQAIASMTDEQIIERLCSIDGCKRKHVARGWCEFHYRRWKRQGNPTVCLKEFTQHGMTGTAEYRAWIDMRRRCNNPDDPNYGGRGIRVCERWLKSFPLFLEDMGVKPSSNLSVERIDNDKGYSPENCKWATASEQVKNRRNNRMITFNGKTLCVNEWARKLGINHGTLRHRLKINTPLEIAFSKVPLAPEWKTRK